MIKIISIGVFLVLMSGWVSANTLIVAPLNQVIFEVNDITGKVVWEYAGFGMEANKFDPVDPTCAQRLKNGDTLIVSSGNNVVFVVRSSDYNESAFLGGYTSDSIVWSYDSNRPVFARRLDNGNTLIAEQGNRRAIEVDPGGSIIWQTPSDLNITYIATVDRLNGKTLITDSQNRVIILNEDNNVTWECPWGSYAAFTPEGNVLITYPDGKVKEYAIGKEEKGTIGEDNPIWLQIQSVLDKQSLAYLTENLSMYLETLDETNTEYYEYQKYLFSWYAENDETYYLNQTVIAIELINDTAIVHITQTYRTLLMGNETVTDYLEVVFRNINNVWKDSGTSVFYPTQNVCSDDHIVWQYYVNFENVGRPLSVQRLENGRTLISDDENNRVFEVYKTRTIVWSYGTGLCEGENHICHPIYAERTPGSRTIAMWNLLFEYNVTDESKIESCSLYTDITGKWEKLITSGYISPGVNNFTIPSLYAGNYIWNVECTDTNGNTAFLEDKNWTFTIKEQ